MRSRPVTARPIFALPILSALAVGVWLAAGSWLVGSDRPAASASAQPTGRQSLSPAPSKPAEPALLRIDGDSTHVPAGYRTGDGPTGWVAADGWVARYPTAGSPVASFGRSVTSDRPLRELFCTWLM